MVGLHYKEIWIETNPWKYGQGECQDLLGVKDELELIVYTPDVEFYCETIEQAKEGIDAWMLKNGSYEFYTAKADKAIGWI